jgi:predicted nucleotidyltransferase
VIDKLFSSKSRVEILKLFLFNPEDSFYQRQISIFAHQPIRSVQREMEKLESIGLIEKSVQGNPIYYKVNKRCPIFEELKRILFKSVGIAEVLKENLKNTGNIIIAFIYGSYAQGKENLLSDIDLLIVGFITSRELSTLLSKPKRELGREINYAVFPPQEFKEKIRQKDHFLNAVLEGKKIFIIGNEDELKRTVKSG